MATDDRAMLELLKDELAFLEQGGHGRSIRSPWVPEATSQDSLTCINYSEPPETPLCSECQLIDFVAHEHHSEEVPCHFIALNDAGETIEDLEAKGNQAELEATLKEWLKAKIKEIEDEGAKSEPKKLSTGWC